MDAKSWVEGNRASFGSEYELMFATAVLPLVEGLAWDTITVQYPFKDKDGKQRYCDFAIIESDNVRVAIEIDGYDKLGAGRGMSHNDFVEWQRRQASLATYGWHVLRFANRDVRDHPRRCAEYVTEMLRKLRRAESGRVELVTVNPAPPQVVDVTPVAKVVQADKPRTVLAIAAVVTGVGAVAAFMWVAAGAINTGSSDGARGIAQAESAAVRPRDKARPTSSVEYGSLACVNSIDWSQAGQHLGRVTTVRGPFYASTKRADLPGSPMWLEVGGTFPSKARLSVVVWGRNWAKFDTEMLDAETWGYLFDYTGNPTLCVRGRITEYKGVPQIELEDPSQVIIF